LRLFSIRAQKAADVKPNQEQSAGSPAKGATDRLAFGVEVQPFALTLQGYRLPGIGHSLFPEAELDTKTLSL
jgi:hypothetical protein